MLWPWHFLKIQAGYFVQCLSVWVWVVSNYVFLESGILLTILEVVKGKFSDHKHDLNCFFKWSFNVWSTAVLLLSCPATRNSNQCLPAETRTTASRRLLGWQQLRVAITCGMYTDLAGVRLKNLLLTFSCIMCFWYALQKHCPSYFPTTIRVLLPWHLELLVL